MDLGDAAIFPPGMSFEGQAMIGTVLLSLVVLHLLNGK